MDLLEIGKDTLDVVEAVRPFRMARVQDPLPGGLEFGRDRYGVG
jgi:hypothetical protein